MNLKKIKDSASIENRVVEYFQTRGLDELADRVSNDTSGETPTADAVIRATDGDVVKFYGRSVENLFTLDGNLKQQGRLTLKRCATRFKQDVERCAEKLGLQVKVINDDPVEFVEAKFYKQ